MIIDVNKQDVEMYLMPYYKVSEKLRTAHLSLFQVDKSKMAKEDKCKFINTLIKDIMKYSVIERSNYYRIKKYFNLPDNFFLDYNKITYEEAL